MQRRTSARIVWFTLRGNGSVAASTSGAKKVYNISYPATNTDCLKRTRPSFLQFPTVYQVQVWPTTVLKARPRLFREAIKRTCSHLASDADLLGWPLPDVFGDFFFSPSCTRRARRFFSAIIVVRLDLDLL